MWSASAFVTRPGAVPSARDEHVVMGMAWPSAMLGIVNGI
jgi:hypothetical protein